MKQGNYIILQGYKSIEPEKLKNKFLVLTLSTETSVNIEQYGGNSEPVVPLMAVVCKCQTDTNSNGGNGYCQPHTVAERCDVTVPCHVGIVGQTYKHVDAGRKTNSCYSMYLTGLLSVMLTCNFQKLKKFIEEIIIRKI